MAERVYKIFEKSRSIFIYALILEQRALANDAGWISVAVHRMFIHFEEGNSD